MGISPSILKGGIFMAMTTMCVAIADDVRQRLRDIGGRRAVGKTITSLVKEHDQDTSMSTINKHLKVIMQRLYELDERMRVLNTNLGQRR
jgi:hypothetical protein